MQVIVEREGADDEAIFVEDPTVTVGWLRREITARGIAPTPSLGDGPTGVAADVACEWDIVVDGDIAHDDAFEIDVASGLTRVALRPPPHVVARKRLEDLGVGHVTIDALLTAAEAGEMDTVRYVAQSKLLSEGDLGQALIAACTRGRRDLVAVYLEEGFPVNLGDARASTPLIWAARNGHQEVCEQLIDAGAELNKKNEDGASALIMAATYAHEDVCKMLLGRGADAETLQIFGWTVGWKGDS